MKLFKFTIRLFFVFSIIFFLSIGWINLSYGFRLDKIKPSNFHKKNNIEHDDDLSSILNQKFKLIGKGSQVYVFGSEDEKYVIKIFRFHKYNLPFWSEYLKKTNFGNKILSEIKKEMNNKYNKAMKSYEIASDLLKEETAIVYLHLNPTIGLDNQFILTDRFNREYKIDLNDYGFIIQKKAKSIKEILSFINKKNDVIALKIYIDSFFDNLGSIYSKGFINDDRHLLKNLAVLDNKILEIDLGGFIKYDVINDKKALRKEAIHYTKYFRKWIIKNMPANIDYFNEQLLHFIERL